MPGFRVTEDELSNHAALDLMDTAFREVMDVALYQRLGLLDAGFTDTHRACQDLDEIARNCSIFRDVVARQRVEVDRLEEAEGG